jgi:hypothetical protein
MSTAPDVKHKVAGAVDRLADDLEALSHKIHDNPELWHVVRMHRRRGR